MKMADNKKNEIKLSEEEKRRFKAILSFGGEYLLIHRNGRCEILKYPPKIVPAPSTEEVTTERLVNGGELNDLSLIKKLEEMFGVESKIEIRQLI